MPYARLADGTLVELVPFTPDEGHPQHRVPGRFQSVMHLPITIEPGHSVEGTSLLALEARASGVQQGVLPEGLAPWQELPSQPKS